MNEIHYNTSRLLELGYPVYLDGDASANNCGGWHRNKEGQKEASTAWELWTSMENPPSTMECRIPDQTVQIEDNGSFKVLDHTGKQRVIELGNSCDEGEHPFAPLGKQEIMQLYHA